MIDVLLEQRGSVAILQLNRPQQRNALSRELIQAVQLRLDELEPESSIRALVITGGEVFSSGADLASLHRLRNLSSEANKSDAGLLAQLLKRLYTFPKPIIAAVEGYAIAGGAGLATACDLVISSEDAQFAYTEVRLGFVAAIVSVLLLRCVGEKHARELLLSARLIGAAEAHRIGLINEIVPRGQALERAIAVADEIAGNSASGLAATKEILAMLPGMGLEEGLRYATTLNAWTRTTDDLKEGVEAFLAKRSPSWKSEAK